MAVSVNIWVITLQRVCMKNRYIALINRTGVSGDLSQLDKEVLRTMNKDKDISAEVVGSSSNAVKVTGNRNILTERPENRNTYFICQTHSNRRLPY